MVNSFFETLTKIYIVGASSRAKTLTGYLAYLYPVICVSAYLVDSLDDNDLEVNKVPVQVLNGDNELCTEYPVLVSTKGIYHKEIINRLIELGFQTILPITPEVDNFLRNEYVKSVFESEGRAFCKIEQMECKSEFASAEVNVKDATDKQITSDIPVARIYMAKSIYDKELQSEYQMPDYESAIQVGVSLTEQRLADCDYMDNIGDNISDKNRQYCELTAMYWIWKHATEQVVGLSHYRRHFILPKDWQWRMKEYDVDVILPVPTFVQPNIELNYHERHDAGDLEEMFAFLKNRDAEDYRIAQEVFSGNLYYPCNMFIMKTEVLNELCEWLFPVLDAVTNVCGYKEDIYLNRYPGFLSERLVTVFFTKFKDKYRIVLADKNFVS